MHLTELNFAAELIFYRLPNDIAKAGGVQPRYDHPEPQQHGE